MSNKLRVDQLRSQLAQRGLDISGTKPVLVQRLDSALLIETTKAKDDEINEELVNKKRKRVSEEDLIVNDVEKLHQMSIKQLREQANLRGVPANGSKKQLLERICAHDSLSDNVEIPHEEDVGGNEKLVKVTKKGVDVLDQKVSSDDGEVNKVEDVEKLREMGIRQLREQATLRGILTNGSKKQLLESLCADSLNQPEEITEKADAGTRNKLVKATKKGGAVLDQKLPSEDGDINVTETVEEVDKLREMGIRQLREQATCRGVSADGSKKQLLERLCADSLNEPENDEVGKEKLVKATKKGGVVLDQWLPDHIKTQYHVLQHGEEIYDAMLNQTNVGGNNNKFYVIQALESDDGHTFMVYNRWGRVGIKGQDKLHGPYTSRDSAITEFELKFNAKTKNEWSDRKNFVCKPRCYAWLEMDYGETESNSIVAERPNHSIQPRETKLEPRIAKFISLICNVSMMKQQMMEIGYNAEKLPLGKLSKSTILKGYGVLKRISEVISQSNRKTLEELSGEFYTVIPHDFGFKKMSEFVIDTPHKLKMKLQMVEALGEIELATKLLSDGIEMQEDPLYSHYQHLCCDLTALDIHSEEHSMIERYMRNTHASTHSNYSVDIVQIFRISRHGETERFKKYFSTKNRMLLWHGSRLTNWTGILSQGLRIAPPEAPSTGYMFGKGVYFADMFSKSANYCYSSQSSSSGVLLLCEVALGDVAEYTNANYDADKLPNGKLSTKGVGTTAPDPSEYKALEDGVVVPLGKPKPQSGKQGGALLYNEFIVYNVDQIRMRYVIQVNFNFKRSH